MPGPKGSLETSVVRCDVVDKETREVVGLCEVATITHQGVAHEACGAYVDPKQASGYIKIEGDERVGARGHVCGWEGDVLGTAIITSRWPNPAKWESRWMCQIECYIDGVWYTGRGCGNGMLWKGKRKTNQIRPSTWF